MEVAGVRGGPQPVKTRRPLGDISNQFKGSQAGAVKPGLGSNAASGPPAPRLKGLCGQAQAGPKSHIPLAVRVDVAPSKSTVPVTRPDVDVDLCTRRTLVHEDPDDVAFMSQLDMDVNGLLSRGHELLGGALGPMFEDLGLPPFGDGDDMDAGL